MHPFSESPATPEERARAVRYWEAAIRNEVSRPEVGPQHVESLQEAAERLKAQGWADLVIGEELRAKLDSMKSRKVGEAA